MSFQVPEDEELAFLLDLGRSLQKQAALETGAVDSPTGAQGVISHGREGDGQSLGVVCQRLGLEEARAELKRIREERESWQSRIEASFLENFGRVLTQREFLSQVEEALENQEQALKKLRARVSEEAVLQALELPSLEHELKTWQNRLQPNGDISTYRVVISYMDQLEMAIRTHRYEEAVPLQARLLAELPTMPSASSAMTERIRGHVVFLRSVLLKQLLENLEEATTLTQCIEIGSFLRAMDWLEVKEMRQYFLLCRGRGFGRLLRETERACEADSFAELDCFETGAAQRLIRLTNTLRGGILRIATEYEAVFPEDTTVSTSSLPAHQHAILPDEPWRAWHRRWLDAYLRIVDRTIQHITDSSTLQAVYTYTMEFAEALSRLDLDFRPLLIPLYERSVLRIWERNLHLAVWRYAESLKSLHSESLPAQTCATHRDGKLGDKLSSTVGKTAIVEDASSLASMRENSPHLAPLTQFGDELENAIQQLTLLLPRRGYSIFAAMLLSTFSDAIATVIELTLDRTEPGSRHRFVLLSRFLKRNLFPGVMNRFCQATNVSKEESMSLETAVAQLNDRLDLFESATENLSQVDA
jgi:hypothetical protein